MKKKIYGGSISSSSISLQEQPWQKHRYRHPGPRPSSASISSCASHIPRWQHVPLFCVMVWAAGQLAQAPFGPDFPVILLTIQDPVSKFLFCLNHPGQFLSESYPDNSEIFTMWCVQLLNHVQLFATPWTVAHKSPLPMEFSRQEYLRRVPFPTPEDLPNPGIKPTSLTSPALAGRFFTTSATWEAQS